MGKVKEQVKFTKTDYKFAARRLDGVIEGLVAHIQETYFLQKLLLEHLHVPHVGLLVTGYEFNPNLPEKLNYDASQYPDYTFDLYFLWSLRRSMGKSELLPIYVELMEKEGYGINLITGNIVYDTARGQYHIDKMLFTLTGPKWEARLSEFSGAARSLGHIVIPTSMSDAWRVKDMYNLELVTTAAYETHCFYVNGKWLMLKATPKEEMPNLEIYEFIGRYVTHGHQLETVKKVLNMIVEPLSEEERRLLTAFYMGNASIPGAQANLENEIKTLTEKLAIATGALAQLNKREFKKVDDLIIENSSKLMSLATSGKVHQQVSKAAQKLIKIE